MTHETNDPPRPRERPADGPEIVRLAMEWRKLQRAPDVGWSDLKACRDAFAALCAAVDTRLPDA